MKPAPVALGSNTNGAMAHETPSRGGSRRVAYGTIRDCRFQSGWMSLILDCVARVMR